MSSVIITMVKSFSITLALLTAMLMTSDAVAKVKVGDTPLKKVSVTKADGTPVANIGNKNIVVLTFGASWCAPCKKELPAYEKLAQKHKKKVSFVAVNVDEDKDKGKAFMKAAGLKNMRGVFDVKQATVEFFDPPKMPTTYILKNGKVVFMHGGYAKGDESHIDKKILEFSK